MGWIPSSTTNVILNWPQRIKNPTTHDDRDKCFLPFDSKRGPCGMTENNDIDDDSATKTQRFSHDRCITGLVILATHRKYLDMNVKQDGIRCGHGNLRNTIATSIVVHTSDEASQQ